MTQKLRKYRICEVCGNIIPHSPCIHIKKYCSATCKTTAESRRRIAGRYKPAPAICPECGIIFKRKTNEQYCSPTCKKIYHHKLREQRHSNRICVRCGKHPVKYGCISCETCLKKASAYRRNNAEKINKYNREYCRNINQAKKGLALQTYIVTFTDDDAMPVQIEVQALNPKEALILAEQRLPELTLPEPPFEFASIIEITTTNINLVYTAAEAAELWKLDTSTVKKACQQGRFTEDEARKSKGTWLVTDAGMSRLFKRSD